MKRLLPLLILLMALPVFGASVKISDLPLSTSPSTNTFIEIADMDAVTKSSKYLLTNKADATPAGITNALGISTTPTELQYVSGVTSPIQTQLDGKLPAVVGAMADYRGTLTPSSGIVLVDFAQTNRIWTCSPGGNITFALTNASAGKYANILLLMPSTNCTPTFNFPAASVTNFFGGAPTQLTGGTVGSLSYYCIDNSTNSVKAWYTETQ